MNTDENGLRKNRWAGVKRSNDWERLQRAVSVIQEVGGRMCVTNQCIGSTVNEEMPKLRKHAVSGTEKAR